MGVFPAALGATHLPRSDGFGIQGAPKHEDEETEQRIHDGEDIIERQRGLADFQQRGDPGQAEQQRNGHGTADLCATNAGLVGLVDGLFAACTDGAQYEEENHVVDGQDDDTRCHVG